MAGAWVPLGLRDGGMLTRGAALPVLRFMAQVYPARLVFVSFLDVNAKGQMAEACENVRLFLVT
jgi:hypothetical protein